MRFAVNYSPPLARLISSGAIDVDLFKCPDWPDLVEEARTQRPCYVHFSLRAGKRELGQVDWDQARRLVELTQTPYINIHLAPCAADFPGMPLDTRDPGHRAQLIEAMGEDIRQLAERFDPARVILENVMWDPEPPWLIPQPVLEPEVISRIVRDTGCGFVLDLSHARICARHFGVDEEEYVAALPVERMRELHVTGLQEDGAGLWQDHHPMTEEDWRSMEWAMDRIRRGDWPMPWAVAFEYGGVGPVYASRTNEAVLAEQVPRLFDCVRSAV